MEKSDSELKAIALSEIGYVIEARWAAVQVLKERGVDLEVEKSILDEIEKRNQKQQKTEIDQAQLDKKIRAQLDKIPKGTKRVWHLDNGNELQVKRLNESSFQVRIEDHYRSMIAPIMICKIKNDSIQKKYPFFYFTPILIGLGIAIVLVVFQVIGIIALNNVLIVAVISFGFPIIIQLLLAPILYFILKNQFETTLGG